MFYFYFYKISKKYFLKTDKVIFKNFSIKIIFTFIKIILKK